MRLGKSFPVKLELHEWASLRSELIWIYDRQVLPRYRQGRSQVEQGIRLWYIRRGTVSIRATGRTLVAGPGKWVMPGEDFREHTFSPEAHILSLRFLCQWPSGERLISIPETRIVRGDRFPALERSARKLVRLLSRAFPGAGQREEHYNRELSDYPVFNRFQGLFLDWLAIWFRFCLENGGQLTRLTTGDSRPFVAARILNQAPLSQAFPVERLQQETSLGLARLNQLFFREFKMTTRKLWDRRRLDFARQCLEASPMSIKEISYRLNFRSSSHFVVWFKRATQTRPNDYRRAHLQQSPPASRKA